MAEVELMRERLPSLSSNGDFWPPVHHLINIDQKIGFLYFLFNNDRLIRFSLLLIRIVVSKIYIGCSIKFEGHFIFLIFFLFFKCCNMRDIVFVFDNLYWKVELTCKPPTPPVVTDEWPNLNLSSKSLWKGSLSQLHTLMQNKNVKYFDAEKDTNKSNSQKNVKEGSSYFNFAFLTLHFNIAFPSKITLFHHRFAFSRLNKHLVKWLQNPLPGPAAVVLSSREFTNVWTTKTFLVLQKVFG